jgi:uncharacterized DUF497 family protein
MNFEYDPIKSETNKNKHGIDFENAQSLWSDQNRVEIETYSTIEPRTMVIGKIQNKHWSAIITYRGQTVRIISIRRSRKSEVKLYES